ncbi:MAG TPA: hypothetical protein DEP84_31330 [Chloroflexi bacterium]|nr:hypothetical protein [Chloroflexota bacterium]
MKFLIDAQLPRRFARYLSNLGHDAVHTLDLPRGNRTKGQEIDEISIQEGRVVVTKDSDFVNSFILHNQPYKLLLISTGNITNAELERLLTENFDDIVTAFEDYDFIELSREHVVIHG